MAENGDQLQDEFNYTEESESTEQLDAGDGDAVDGDAVNESGTQDGLEVADSGDGGGGGAGSPDGVEDPELEAIKARVREMEEEAEKLKEMQSEVEKQMNLSSPTNTSLTSPQGAGATAAFPTMEEKLDADQRSVYCGNVDYGATAQELEAHFHGCGSINRVTILCDKFSGNPKGFAYVEFADKDSVHTAQALDDSLFRGRQIKVTAKRTNRPGMSSTDRAPRGGRFRGRSRPSYYGGGGGGYAPRRRGGFRPRRMATYYSPY